VIITDPIKQIKARKAVLVTELAAKLRMLFGTITGLIRGIAKTANTISGTIQ
jgi:hypothetical protein